MLILYLVGIALSVCYYVLAEPYWEYSDIYEYHTWYLVLTVVMLVVYILEFKLFKKTWNTLERMEYSKELLPEGGRKNVL